MGVLGVFRNFFAYVLFKQKFDVSFVHIVCLTLKSYCFFIVYAFLCSFVFKNLSKKIEFLKIMIACLAVCLSAETDCKQKFTKKQNV